MVMEIEGDERSSRDGVWKVSNGALVRFPEAFTLLISIPNHCVLMYTTFCGSMQGYLGFLISTLHLVLHEPISNKHAIKY